MGERLTVTEAAELAGRVLDEVERAVVGKREALTLVLAAVLAKGHVLLEDFPGLGKTLAARSFAQALGLEFARAQFTPDLLPSDLTGSFVYNQQRGEFEFRRGPLFTGLLLADEINRTPPKTQSALLEAMQERQVTVEGETFPLPEPFHVLATANPIEYEGTYPLPEAQLDRFLMRVSFGYPSADEEYDVLARRVERRREEITLDPVTDADGRARDAGGGRDGAARRERRPLLRRPRRRHPRPSRRADRCVAARLAGSGAGGPGVRADPRPRLRHPRGRQGRRATRAGAPDHDPARALDDATPAGARSSTTCSPRCRPRPPSSAEVEPSMTRWRPTAALSRALVVGGSRDRRRGAGRRAGRPGAGGAADRVRGDGPGRAPDAAPRTVTSDLDHVSLHEGQGTTSRLQVTDADDVEQITRAVAEAAVRRHPSGRGPRLAPVWPRACPTWRSARAAGGAGCSGRSGWRSPPVGRLPAGAR